MGSEEVSGTSEIFMEPEVMGPEIMEPEVMEPELSMEPDLFTWPAEPAEPPHWDQWQA